MKRPKIIKNKDKSKKNMDTGMFDIESLLEKRERIDSLLEKKYTKVITVMFTDLSGSTSFAEKHGDMAGRLLIKRMDEILFSVIKEHKGHLVKTMGDGALSYFDEVGSCIKAAIEILKAIKTNKKHTQKRLPLI